MPIHLPPLSRRRFLVGSLTLAAGAFFRRSLAAAEAPEDPHVWALLSDPHIAADRAAVSRNVNMTDNLKAVGAELTALGKRPAAVIVNGDCAFTKGELEDYSVFVDLLKPVREAKMPVHLTLGNHDDREHFWSVVSDAKKGAAPVPNKHVSIVRAARANWFLLDSLEAVNSTPGSLGPEQRDWLAKALDENADKPAIVLTHHNPGKEGAGKPLKDTPELMEILRPRKQVKAHIYGHTHIWEIQKDTSGIHLINLPPVGYPFKADNPSGWVKATLASDAMKLELSCLDKTHKVHGETVNLSWRTA